MKNNNQINYQLDGETIDNIIEYNEQGQKIKQIFYDLDGKKIDYINEYNSINGLIIKKIIYQPWLEKKLLH